MERASLVDRGNAGQLPLLRAMRFFAANPTCFDCGAESRIATNGYDRGKLVRMALCGGCSEKRHRRVGQDQDKAAVQRRRLQLLEIRLGVRAGTLSPPVSQMSQAERKAYAKRLAAGLK